jgi:type VI secretion system protein VasD
MRVDRQRHGEELIMVEGGRMLLRRTVLVAGLVLVLASCGGKEPPPLPPPPPPGIVDLDLAAAGDVNPDKSGRASPITVTVYQLSGRSAFDGADFFQLSDPKLLGRDLVARDDVALAPGAVRNLTRPLAEGARFVAIVASFQAIDKARWRAVAEVPPHGTTKLAAQLAGISLTLQPGGK